MGTGKEIVYRNSEHVTRWSSGQIHNYRLTSKVCGVIRVVDEARMRALSAGTALLFAGAAREYLQGVRVCVSGACCREVCAREYLTHVSW